MKQANLCAAWTLEDCRRPKDFTVLAVAFPMAGQPDTVPKGAGVKALSSRLLQMNFMRRGQAAEVATKATAPAASIQASFLTFYLPSPASVLL